MPFLSLQLLYHNGMQIRYYRVDIYYRFDLAPSGRKDSIGGDVMKITRLYKDSQTDQYKSLEEGEPFEGVFP